jgi:hypothetical protein
MEVNYYFSHCPFSHPGLYGVNRQISLINRLMKSAGYRVLLLFVLLMGVSSSSWAETATDTLINGKSFMKIANAADLKLFRDSVNKGEESINAILTDNIDLSSETSWTPIGSETYKGIFEGNGKTITLLNNVAQRDRFGLFTYNYGIIRNVTVNASIIARLHVAAIVVFNYGTVSHCVATGSVTGYSYVGGLVSKNLDAGVIEYCVNRAAVAITSNNEGYAGGITSYNGASSSNKEVGKGLIAGCENYGAVTGKSHAEGGIAGLSSSPIIDCSNHGNITGTSYIGGLVGMQSAAVSLRNCYNAAAVCASSFVGVIVGNLYAGTISNCYCHSTLSTLNGASSLVAVGSGTGTVTAEDASFFASGTLARLLNGGDGTTQKPNGRWGQKLGSDTYPVISDAKVCNISLEGSTDYHNSGEKLMFTTPVTTTYNGLVISPAKCKGDGNGHIYYGSFTVDSLDADLSDYAYTMADSVMTKDGLTYFVINTPMELDWFRYYVNSGNVLANAILTADIDLSSLCGAATATTSSVSWNPIAGSQAYTGHFDGNGHTVKNLNDNPQYVPLKICINPA